MMKDLARRSWTYPISFGIRGDIVNEECAADKYRDFKKIWKGRDLSERLLCESRHIPKSI